MTTEMDDVLPTALDCRKKSAEMEAEKASECMRKRAAAEAEKNCISHILSSIPYKNVKRPKVNLPRRSNKGAYDDQASLKARRFVSEHY